MIILDLYFPLYIRLKFNDLDWEWTHLSSISCYLKLKNMHVFINISAIHENTEHLIENIMTYTLYLFASYQKLTSLLWWDMLPLASKSFVFSLIWLCYSKMFCLHIMQVPTISMFHKMELHLPSVIQSHNLLKGKWMQL